MRYTKPHCEIVKVVGLMDIPSFCQKPEAIDNPDCDEFTK
jgi:hypothetical protein